MIYTVTLKTGLDYFAMTDTREFGKTNRTHDEYVVPGGKGLNVSVVLSRLGDPSTAFSFVSGFTGHEVERLMNEENVACDFIDVGRGFTRINVKLVAEETTEYNGSGIFLKEEEIAALEEKLGKLEAGDVLVMSGNIPKGADKNIYRRLAEASSAETIVVDSSGSALLAALPAKPFLVKPNLDELEDILHVKINNEDELVKGALALQNMGARNVLISLGAEGAMLVTEEGEVFSCDAPKGQVVNTVGAGDSMLAGFLHRFMETGDYYDALKFSVAAGTATAFSSWLATKGLIEALYEDSKEA